MKQSHLLRLSLVAGLAIGLRRAIPVETLAAQTVSVSGTGNTTALRWGKIPAVTGFQVARRQLVLDQAGQVKSATSYVTLATLTGFGYNDVLPVPSLVYEYQVSAIGVNGQVYPGQPVQYIAGPFTTITNLTVTSISTRADVAWTAAYGVAGYHVWRRKIQQDGSIAELGQRTTQLLPTPGFADPTIVPGGLYEYQVISVVADGSTWPSQWVRYLPPVAPVLTLGGAGDRVILTWMATAGATGYHIARYVLDQTGQRTGGGQITASPVVGDSYSDGVPAPALYEYRVIGVMPDGSTLPSQPATYAAPAFTTPVGVAAAAVGLRGVVAWNPALGVTGYQVWRRFLDPNGRASASTQVASIPAAGTAWLDGLPDTRSMVEYQVVGLSTDGRSWPSAWVRGR